MRLLLLFLLLPQLALADCRETADTNPSCIDTDKLYLRLGMGLGHRSNPVAGGRNLPYWLMPDLSYYSKHWFFDNSTLGYSFELTPAWQLSMVTRLNEEKGYFQRAHASNLLNRFMVSNAEIVGPTLRNQQLQQLSIKDVKNRPTALDAGLQLDWFSTATATQSELVARCFSQIPRPTCQPDAAKGLAARPQLLAI